MQNNIVYEATPIEYKATPYDIEQLEQQRKLGFQLDQLYILQQFQLPPQLQENLSQIQKIRNSLFPLFPNGGIVFNKLMLRYPQISQLQIEENLKSISQLQVIPLQLQRILNELLILLQPIANPSVYNLLGIQMSSGIKPLIPDKIQSFLKENVPALKTILLVLSSYIDLLKIP